EGKGNGENMRRLLYLLALVVIVLIAYALIPKQRSPVTAATIQGGISTLDLMEGKAEWLKVMRFDKPLDVAQALSKGEVDVAVITSEMYAKFALSSKRDLKIIAAEMLQNQAVVGVSDLKDLEGKRIGATTASGTYAMFQAYTRLAGVKEYEVVDMPPPQLVAALNRGDIDAAVVWEPVASKLIAKGYEYVDFVDLAERYVDKQPIMLVWVATEDFLRRPDDVKAFLELRERAAQRWDEEAPSILKKLYGLNDNEVNTLMARVRLWTGGLEGARESIISAWELARQGGYLKVGEDALKELASKAFWGG
ncbi:MAG: ABC transporter substrate-binding protein, partial [Candidatus Korarchaeota archaeon]|nr:ABC transporter substrate-binding protein [Candidatus Korarchaeota archaeon]